MILKLHKSEVHRASSITITGSKSESNRLLLLQALFPELVIKNCSNSDDSKVMAKALAGDDSIIDIHHAGTAMRFLTAFFASRPGKEVVLTGSQRMKERPIAILVEALKALGADISYLETEGCPPLLIKGKTLSKNQVSLKANVSSQYISALLLIASKLENGLALTLEGDITSMPYIQMTLDLLSQLGIESHFKNQTISVQPKVSPLKTKVITVESDWSSASYYFSMVALSPVGTEITLSSYKKTSLQGDSVLIDIYKLFGVASKFDEHALTLIKQEDGDKQPIIIDLKNAPDIAQTIAVTCLGLGLECQLSGLHTLKIKETDRLVALQNELQKFGAQVIITSEALQLQPISEWHNDVTIATYNDHRMAMAFAPLALKTNLNIEDYMVVSKSYPTFWDDLKAIGFKFSK
ncbi:3-phosphoshikimate 1-carboxyvinyltransferase [Psychroserpens sp. BH13MA-6]